MGDMSRALAAIAVCLLAACGTTVAASAAASTAGTPAPTATVVSSTLGPCVTYPLPSLDVGAEVQHLKTIATVVAVTSPCSVRVRIGNGNSGSVAVFNDLVITLRATTRTTYITAAQGDLGAIGRFGLKAGDVFTLSFDSRPFPDGSYPLNFMNW